MVADLQRALVNETSHRYKLLAEAVCSESARVRVPACIRQVERLALNARLAQLESELADA